MGPRSDQLSLLAGLDPEAFRYGTIVLFEFEPHSLWYETSVTLAARSLALGSRTDYHTFQHVPDDVLRALLRQGIDVPEMQRSGLFRLIDSYSPQTGLAVADPQRPYQFASQSLRIGEWKKGALNVLDDPHERRIVHIDENDSLLTRYNRERDILDFFQTRAFEAARKREFLFVHALMKGVHTKGFYRQLESLADVVLDVRSREIEGHLEQVLRLRAIRGIAADSRWRLLTLTGKGEVRVLGPARAVEASSEARRPKAKREEPTEMPWGATLEFAQAKAGKVFDALVDAYVEDSRVHRLEEGSAGWRSLVQLARETNLSQSSLYPRRGAVNPVMGELTSRGLVEMRVVPGARGRGGIVMRVRIAADREAVKPYLRQRIPP